MKIRERTLSKKEILVGWVLALAFFSIVAYVCFYFAQLFYYRIHYPIDFVDLRDVPATQPQNPADKVLDTLERLCDRLEYPDMVITEWTHASMTAFVESNADVLVEFRRWRDDEVSAFALEGYEGMGLRRRESESGPSLYWEIAPGFYNFDYFKLARLLAVKGVLEIRANRETLGMSWIADSFAICHFLLQNATYLTLTNANKVFRANLNFLLQYLPEQYWYPHMRRWLPTEATWRRSLSQAMWSSNINKFRLVDIYYGNQHLIKPSWSENLRFQYSQVDTLRLFSQHYQDLRHAALTGPMVYPTFEPEKDRVSRKINQSPLKMIVNGRTMEKVRFSDASLHIIISHAILTRAALLEEGLPITQATVIEQLGQEGFSNPITNHPYQVNEHGALGIPREFASDKMFTYQEEGVTQSRYQNFFDLGLLVPASQSRSKQR